MRRLAAEAAIVEGSALLALGRVDEARRQAAAARRLAVALGAPPVLHRAHELTGRIAEACGRPDRARRSYAEAIGHLEREQRGVIFEFRDSFAAGREGAYERYAALLLDHERADEALAIAERAKSRAVIDAVTGSVELQPRGSATARRVARELERAREQYAAAFAELEQAESADRGAGDGRDADTGHLTALEERIGIAPEIERLIRTFRSQSRCDRAKPARR